MVVNRNPKGHMTVAWSLLLYPGEDNHSAHNTSPSQQLREAPRDIMKNLQTLRGLCLQITIRQTLWWSPSAWTNYRLMISSQRNKQAQSVFTQQKVHMLALTGLSYPSYRNSEGFWWAELRSSAKLTSTTGLSKPDISYSKGLWCLTRSSRI